MDNVFIIDVEKCNGCYDCVMACNDENLGDIPASTDMPHPSLGQFLLKVEQHLYGDPPKVKQYFLVKPCMHCANAPCMQSCPVEAIRINDHGLVELVQDKCISCRLCVYACPYDAFYYNRERNVISKCSGCTHLLDKGLEPACVSVCDRKALIFGNRDALKEQLKDAEQIIIEEGMKPCVYYKNTPF